MFFFFFLGGGGGVGFTSETQHTARLGGPNPPKLSSLCTPRNPAAETTGGAFLRISGRWGEKLDDVVSDPQAELQSEEDLHELC